MISRAPRARILAVDDDPGILRAVLRVFQSQYEVACAPGPSAALDMADGFSPEVAVIDIRMPEMNGIELMRRLHERLPGLDVILMTGNAEDPDANLVQAIDGGAFYFVQKPFERRVLLALVNRCLELRRLREEKQQYTQRMERDLEEARQFQVSLLPPAELKLKGLSIRARHVPCRQLAGDFYDYVPIGDRAAALVIADVVGHGTSAAMMTGIVKAAFHAARAEDFEPLSVINRVKEGIRSFQADRFITLAAIRLDGASRRLDYASAGHPPLVVYRPESAPLLLDSTGPLLSSALNDLPCAGEDVALEGCDSLLVYTDGVVEAPGPGGSFGSERMISAFNRDGSSGRRQLDNVLAAVAEFSGNHEQHDDMTLVSVEFLN